MSESTKTQSGRPTYTPGSDKPPRKSKAVRATEMAGKALKGTGEHRVAEFFLGTLGLALAASGVWIIYVQGKDIGMVVSLICLGLIVGGLSMIPTAIDRVAVGIGKVGPKLAAAWKAKDNNGGAP